MSTVWVAGQSNMPGGPSRSLTYSTFDRKLVFAYKAPHDIEDQDSDEDTEAGGDDNGQDSHARYLTGYCWIKRSATD